MEFERIWIFVNYLAFIFTASPLWSSTDCQIHPGYKIITRTPIHVQRGLCAHIPCTFTVPANIRLTVQTNAFWNRLSGGRLTSVASRENSEYRTNGHVYLTGNVTAGDCSYYIENPRPKDESFYAFRIEDIQTRYTYSNIQPYVEVTELTDKPTISSTRLLDGEDVTLTCTSPGTCRNITPNITWEGTMADIIQKIYNITYEDGSRTFHSNVTFTPRKWHNNSTISCTVTFMHDLTTVEQQTLNVEYSPSMNITIEGGNTSDTSSVTVKDGDSITLKCIVDSNPKALITWYKDDVEVHRNISNQTVTLELMNITRSDAGRFQCSAMNEHGVTHRRVEIMYHNTASQFSSVMAAAIGVILLVLITVIGASLIIYFGRKRQKNIKGNLKDRNINDNDHIYCSPEFTIPYGNPPEETLGKDLQSAGDAVYVNPDEVQYSSIEFSKLKPKVVQENTETEYSEIKKTQNNGMKGLI